jgi:alkaline phosphatase
MSGIACTTTKKYSVMNAHSHNDYLNVSPFLAAYNEGFGSIEADIFPVNGVLYVAHKKEAIQTKNTLKALYLEPLLATLSTDSSRQLNLLVDIKENHALALSLLIEELQPLMKYLATPGRARNLTISISGERPPPADYGKYPDYIFFDDDLKLKHSPDQWKRVHLVSLPFDKISKWKGAGPIPANDGKQLRKVIDSVHAAGKPFRFWAAPDTIPAWRKQQKLGVDLIGTDKVTELGSFLKNGAR